MRRGPYGRFPSPEDWAGLRHGTLVRAAILQDPHQKDIAPSESASVSRRWFRLVLKDGALLEWLLAATTGVKVVKSSVMEDGGRRMMAALIHGRQPKRDSPRLDRARRRKPKTRGSGQHDKAQSQSGPMAKSNGLALLNTVGMCKHERVAWMGNGRFRVSPVRRPRREYERTSLTQRLVSRR